MKKVNIFVLFIVVAVFLMGCSNNSSVLTEDDFSIYMNGEVYLNPKDAVDAHGRYSYSFLEDSNKEIQTKRGLKVGSTITQVKKLYGNIKVTTEETDLKTVNEYLEQNRESTTSLRIGTYKYDGNVHGGEEVSNKLADFFNHFNEILESKRYTPEDEKYMDNMPDIELFTLYIELSEEKVKDIKITYETPEGFKKVYKMILEENAQ